MIPSGCGICVVSSRTNLVCNKPESLTIVSIGTIESVIQVSGLNSPLSPYTVITVQIWFTHTWNGDCEIRLYAPDGTYIILSNRRGSSYDNVFNGALFTDSASTSASAYPYSDNIVATPIKPEQLFSTLRGKNPNGNWKLWIQDYANLDSGTLSKVVLNIQGKTNLIFYWQVNKYKININNRWMFDWKSMSIWNLFFNRNVNLYMFLSNWLWWFFL